MIEDTAPKRRNLCKWLIEHPKLNRFWTVERHNFRGHFLHEWAYPAEHRSTVHPGRDDKLCGWPPPIREQVPGATVADRRHRTAAGTSPDATGGNGSRIPRRRPVRRMDSGASASAAPNGSADDRRPASFGGWTYGFQTWMRSAYSSSGIWSTALTKRIGPASFCNRRCRLST